MGLEALLTRLEGRTVTPAPSAVTPDVTAKPLPTKDCTAVTPVTAAKSLSCSIAAIAPVAERAGITKPDGGSLHNWAAALTRLQTMRKPADTTTGRWAQLQADAAQFAGLWSGFALSLGWGSLQWLMPCPAALLHGLTAAIFWQSANALPSSAAPTGCKSPAGAMTG